MIATEQTLLAVLNSAPVIEGQRVETLDDPALARLRDEIQAVIRGEAAPAVLAPYLAEVRRVPIITDRGVDWEIEAPAGALQQVELVLGWARVQREMPGRLRPCANPDCSKFLIDHSRPNSARWCSMAECGNRMKARRHYARKAG